MTPSMCLTFASLFKGKAILNIVLSIKKGKIALAIGVTLD